MDSRFYIRQTERRTSCNVPADVPLVTIAWRSLRQLCRRAAEDRKQSAAEATTVYTMILGLANELFRLRRRADSPEAPPVDTGRSQDLMGIATHLARILEMAGVRILAPEGEPYADELMDVFENIAQLPDARATGLRVAEVVVPAVTYKGVVLQMGKAVIAVPTPQGPTAATAGPQRAADLSPFESNRGDSAGNCDS